jgi:hypothetical protein
MDEKDAMEGHHQGPTRETAVTIEASVTVAEGARIAGHGLGGILQAAFESKRARGFDPLLIIHRHSRPLLTSSSHFSWHFLTSFRSRSRISTGWIATSTNPSRGKATLRDDLLPEKAGQGL